MIRSVVARPVLTGLILAALGMAAFGDSAAAQPVRQDIMPLNLPRPGYEYEGFRLGKATLLAQLDASAEYDSNLFATSRNVEDDVRFVLAPSIVLQRLSGGTTLRAEAHGALRRHLDHSRENSNAFGAAARFGLSTKGGQALSASLAYDRAIESRADPETRAGPTERPRKIDIYRGDASYRHRFGRVSAEVAGAAEQFDFLDRAESDRDMRSYRGSLRLAYQAASSFDIFVEGFANRRDFDRATDFNGVDRDATTIGAYVGMQREIGQRLRGRIGVGVFRSNPDSPTLKAFTGVGANGELVWHPRTRTAFTLSLSRGDVATVRAGATGRVDTIVGLAVHQEIRHNLLARLSAAYTDRQYRGSARGHLKTVGVEGELEFLLNRHTSLRAGASHANRSAGIRDDHFNRTMLTIGIRQKF